MAHGKLHGTITTKHGITNGKIIKWPVGFYMKLSQPNIE